MARVKGSIMLPLVKGVRAAVPDARAFVKLWPQNHDTGALELGEGRGNVRYTLTDYALPAREICEIITGYIVEGLRMAIDRTVRVTHPRCRANGAPACIWDIDLPFAPSSMPPRGG